jgi:hypothetical protein
MKLHASSRNKKLETTSHIRHTNKSSKIIYPIDPASLINHIVNVLPKLVWSAKDKPSK